MNKKTVLFTICTFLSVFVYAQDLKDFVILRNRNDSTSSDTVFGQIELPKKGVFWNVKIKTPSGQKKFKTKEVTALKAGNLYFGSIPYGKSYAIVPRIIGGKIDLFFYYTGSDRLTFISQMQEECHINNNVSFYTPLLISQAIWNATSNYYILDHVSNVYIKVPKSNNKFITQVSYLFKDNDEIYKKIKSGEYQNTQICRIVELYNLSKEKQ